MSDQNVFYSVIDEAIDIMNKQDITDLLKEVNADIDAALERSSNDDLSIDVYNLSANNTVQDLSRIMDYYQINRRKMRKDDMVQAIALFENDSNNSFIVEQRRRLWMNIEELKEDEFFSRFISF